MNVVILLVDYQCYVLLIRLPVILGHFGENHSNPKIT